MYRELIRKRIVFVLPNLGMIGAQRLTATTLRLLDRDRFEPILVVFDDEGPIRRELPNDIPVSVLGMNAWWRRVPKVRVLAWPFALRRLLRQLDPDLAVGPAPITGVMLLLSQIGSRRPVPIITEQHEHLSTSQRDDPGNQHYGMRTLYPKITRLYRRAAAVRCVSEASVVDLEDAWGVPHGLAVAIPPMFEFKHSSRPPWIANDVPVLAGFGRLSTQKDFAFLLRVFARVRESRDCRLLIIGEGPERRSLERLARELGVSADVHLTGYVEHADEWLASADVFALTSIWEGHPAVLVEAMSLGLACVSVDCPSGPDEIIDTDVNGILVRGRDVERFANEVIGLLDSPERRARLGAAARERAHSFSTTQIMPRLTALYERLARRRPGDSPAARSSVLAGSTE